MPLQRDPAKTERIYGDIIFSPEWQEYVFGSLVCGHTFVIKYDTGRLTGDRSRIIGDNSAWKIVAQIKFKASENPVPVIVSCGTEGSVTTHPIRIPLDTEEIEVWFVNTGTSGQEFFDSRFGNNYHFQVQRLNSYTA
eukprot:TRINITY_DN16378_c0_g1_i1.p1 TRINITY_DN16378_c0_g1~~TRINITY_DN16378_c0_g1_i1.p1  ORF type:complete len:137 (+),score=11.18 TRINITY_DN16378_c0_g1_i1:43-453(+)